MGTPDPLLRTRRLRLRLTKCLAPSTAPREHVHAHSCLLASYSLRIASTYSYQLLHTPTNFCILLPTSTYSYQLLHTPTNFYILLPTSTRMHLAETHCDSSTRLNRLSLGHSDLTGCAAYGRTRDCLSWTVTRGLPPMTASYGCLP